MLVNVLTLGSRHQGAGKHESGDEGSSCDCRGVHTKLPKRGFTPPDAGFSAWDDILYQTIITTAILS